MWEIIWLTVAGIVVSELCENTNTTSCVHEICYDDQVPTCDSGYCTCGPKPTGVAARMYSLTAKFIYQEFKTMHSIKICY